MAADEDREGPNWSEIIATVLLSIATVASAFSGYQSARWSGEQAKANRAAGALRTESTRQSNLASSQTVVDVMTFAAWVDAVAVGDERRSDFYEDRFRPDFVPAFEDWVGTARGTGEVPDGTPFASELYVLPAALEAERLVVEADAAAARSDEANQHADNFVFTAVIYASVLFFAGIASKMSGRVSNRIAVGLAGLMFVVATTVVVNLPWNVGF